MGVLLIFPQFIHKKPLIFLEKNYLVRYVAHTYRIYMQAGRQADRQTARQPGSQAARQPGSQAGRQTDIQTYSIICRDIIYSYMYPRMYVHIYII